MKKIVLLLLFIYPIICHAQRLEEIRLNKVISIDGIYVDKDGSIYVTEGWDGAKIHKISPEGQVSEFASGLKGPIDIIKGKNGNFYVSEWRGSRLSKITPSGEVRLFANTKPGPGPMTEDVDGNIYVSHNVNDHAGFISKISQDGRVEIYSDNSMLVNPGGLDFDEKGNLYVVSFTTAKIIMISPNKKHQSFITVPGNQTWKAGHLKYINNAIYVSGLMSHIIYKIEKNGQISVLAGTGEIGHEASSNPKVKITNPNGIAYDIKNQLLYFSAAFEKVNYIQRISMSN